MGKRQIEETLRGVGIGENTARRNSKSGVGDGTLLSNSSNTRLEIGKVISGKRYEWIRRRLTKSENRHHKDTWP